MCQYEYDGNGKTEDGAGQDLEWFVADTFFEVRKLRLVKVEFHDESVEVHSVFTHPDAQAEGIEDNQNSKTKRQSEDGRVPSFEDANRGDERGDEGGVSAGHVAVSNGIAQIKAMLPPVDDEFDEGGEGEGNNRDDEKGEVGEHRRINEK